MAVKRAASWVSLLVLALFFLAVEPAAGGLVRNSHQTNNGGEHPHANVEKVWDVVVTLQRQQEALIQENQELKLELESVRSNVVDLQSIVLDLLSQQKPERRRRRLKMKSRGVNERNLIEQGSVSAADREARTSKRLTREVRKLNNEVRTLDLKINTDVSNLDLKLSGEVSDLDFKLSHNVDALDTKITTDVTNLDNKLAMEVNALSSALEEVQLKIDNGMVLPPGTTAAPTRTSAPSPKPVLPPPTPPAIKCGCATCSEAALYNRAPWDSSPQYTCGSRIEWMKSPGGGNVPDEVQACRLVAGNEFPGICGPCNPDECVDMENPPSDLVTQQAVSFGGLFGNEPMDPERDLYCFPPHSQRVRYTGQLWNKNYIVEVKRDPTGAVCGPGNNIFSEQAVGLVNMNELSMQFRNVPGQGWAGSEVRILLPQNEMPYRYGKYSFSVKSIQVKKEGTNAVVRSNLLPVDLVLGLFTWDTTDRFEIHENWNHEVDIEISRWGNANPTNPDTQFLVQPPDEPHYTRFFSGVGNTYDPEKHVYDFEWKPNSLHWSTDAAGGKDFDYTTQQANKENLPDRIMCLPKNVEVRINLWNFKGAVQPSDIGSDEYVEVVIDDFTYSLGASQHASDNDHCSKHCQCSASSRCINNVCKPLV